MTSTASITSPKATNETLDYQKTERKEKKVTFHERVRQRHIDVVPEAEVADFWYTSSYITAARGRERVLRSYIQRSEKNEGNLNAQGITTKEEFHKKRLTVVNSILAVLSEQENQDNSPLGLHDGNQQNRSLYLGYEKIVRVYRPTSQAALEQAQYRARSHEEHLRDIASQPSKVASSVSSCQIHRQGLSPLRSPRGAGPRHYGNENFVCSEPKSGTSDRLLSCKMIARR